MQQTGSHSAPQRECSHSSIHSQVSASSANFLEPQTDPSHRGCSRGLRDIGDRWGYMDGMQRQAHNKASACNHEISALYAICVRRCAFSISLFTSSEGSLVVQISVVFAAFLALALMGMWVSLQFRYFQLQVGRS